MEFLRLYRLLHHAMQQGVDQALREMGVDLTSAQLDALRRGEDWPPEGE